MLIRDALPGFQSRISPDELPGLACENEVESRLVQGRLGAGWRLEHGPFESERLERLPERDWTLLVQDVDKWVPELGQLLQPFRFLPDWRIDDEPARSAATACTPARRRRRPLWCSCCTGWALMLPGRRKRSH